MPRGWKVYILSNTAEGILLHSDAIWLEKYWSHISMSYDGHFSQPRAKDCRVSHWWYYSQKLKWRRPSQRFLDSILLNESSSVKDESNKVFPGVSRGKFLGFVVMATDIRIDPKKVKAIQDMQPLRNIKKLQGLQGWLTYIRHAIANLAIKCQSFSRLLKKGASFIWDAKCQRAFDNIELLVLIALVSDKVLVRLLYYTSRTRKEGFKEFK